MEHSRVTNHRRSGTIATFCGVLLVAGLLLMSAG